MVRRHFEMQKIDVDKLSEKDKARLLFHRFLKGEIDIETYKKGLDLLHEKQKRFDDVGYV